MKKQHLIVHRRTEICIIMCSGTGDKIVRDISVQQFFVQLTVEFGISILTSSQ